ncbi:MAG: 4Fe-4S dicluster domain-containing protein [Gemmatimonadetes bacterium]|nr:4Fe-4S dicluster domain-containing protein [Gemmatimonadota bacterium]
MRRRSAVKTLALAAGSTLAGRNLAQARQPSHGNALAATAESRAILVDTTKCLGCRMCERACAESNGLPEPAKSIEPGKLRDTSETQFTVVNRYETENGPVNVKRQCMHCLQPACASACLTKAMLKTADGPVIWRGDKCMGCRFCMLSCPFDVPKFEYDSANPRIQKCSMCFDRLREGESPACVSGCPAKATVFGTRTEMLELGWSRIYHEPDKYVHHIYGEHEAGGTGLLYLASVPFDQLGFRTDLSRESYPTFTREFLYAVPFVLTMFPPFLFAVSRATAGYRQEDPEA